MSLHQWPQTPDQPPRTPEQDELFGHGLKHLSILYGHKRTRVLQLKALPEASELQRINPHFNGDYGTSGWCTFEGGVSGVFKDGNDLLDLTSYGDEGASFTYTDHGKIIGQGTMEVDYAGTSPTLKGVRHPPMSRANFDALMDSQSCLYSILLSLS